MSSVSKRRKVGEDGEVREEVRDAPDYAGLASQQNAQNPTMYDPPSAMK